MKMSTLSAIATALSTVEFENKAAILEEVNRDLHRNDAVKAAKASIYEAAKPVVFGLFDQTDAALTVAEMWEAIENDAPEGFTKAKLSYALSHQWKDEVAKVEGKVNAYTKA